MHLIRPHATKMVSESEFENFEGEEEEEHSTRPLAIKLSRTTVQLIDYKMFIAARRIQAFWRGHRVRKLLHQRWQAAIVIQRWWRGFWARHSLREQLEQRLQETILEHFHIAATRIQALYRGWRDRRFIHDVQNLRRMQNSAAEELLNCVILQLYYMRQEGSLPGIFSLRNSPCLSKIEKLKATMLFRFYNGRVLSMVETGLAQREGYNRQFESSTSHTQFPYAGPNFNDCFEPPDDRLQVKNLPDDPRYAQIIAQYEESQLDKNLRNTHLRSNSRKRQELMQNIIARERLATRKFCSYIIDHMRRWTIWGGGNENTKRSSKTTREEMRGFLNRVHQMLSDGVVFSVDDIAELGSTYPNR
ncbi:uncharacterized protein LOC108101361 [Drosophila ficusphila]|uniref:uncharacterized protein LOC108101361 n=1 Tax=Drosophila ficusphila TaxID=30025 RepID=UPI001C89208E|nr:uncharacterized protein LOC108101361 [Drosophila ficusphila]